MNTAYAQNQAQNAYTQTMVGTSAEPLDLIIMLYDGAVSFINKAIFSINKGDTEQKVHYISRTMAVLEELLASLDHKAGEESGAEIAENLQSLYLYMIKELTMANAKNDTNKLKHVQDLLKELSGAWKEIRQ